jgi:hypothetical protein
MCPRKQAKRLMISQAEAVAALILEAAGLGLKGLIRGYTLR